MASFARRWGRRCCGATLQLALLVAVTAARIARADDADAMTRARAAMEALDYSAARTALSEALATGTNGPDQLAEIYLLTGIVTSSLGDADAAVDAFSRLLELSPKAKLVAGTSPKIGKPFAAAGDALKTHDPLHATTETSAVPPSITVVVASDPMGMVAGARAVVIADGKPEQTLEEHGTDKIKIALPHGKRLELRVAVLDSHGNRLVELGSATSPIVIEGAEEPVQVKPVLPPPPPPPPAVRPLYAQWWLWGGVSVALAGTATYFGLAARSAGKDLDALNADSLNHNFGEAKDIESRIRRDALLANLGFGAAGAAAVAAAILFVTRPHDAAQESRTTTVAPVPLRGGAGVTLEVPF